MAAKERIMWNVYYNYGTRQYTVAQVTPHGYFHVYGPASWAACWAVVKARRGY
jgi:hypothetical protein